MDDVELQIAPIEFETLQGMFDAPEPDLGQLSPTIHEERSCVF